jgi:hypothetical protein
MASLLLSPAVRAQTGNPGGPINDHLGDMDYGVCRGTDPVCFHDWHVMPKKNLKVLLFTRSGGPRHITMGPLLPPGINPPLAPTNLIHLGMVRLAAQNGFKLDYSEDLAAFNNLMQYNAVIFYSTSREMLDDNAKTALRQYIRAGGGFVAVHNAFGSMYNWPYYEGLLGNANFYNHRQLRLGDVVVQDTNDASTRGLPDRRILQSHSLSHPCALSGDRGREILAEGRRQWTRLRRSRRRPSGAWQLSSRRLVPIL